MKFPFANGRLVLEVASVVVLAAAVVVATLWTIGPSLDAVSSLLVLSILLSLTAGPLIIWRIRRAVSRATDSVPCESGGSWWRTVIAAALVLCTGLAATAAAATAAEQAAGEVARANFDRLTERLTEETERRVDQARDGLAGARGVFSASEQVERSEFGAYVASRDIAEEFPGAIGFGFIERVLRPDLDDYIARQRADGLPEFDVYGLADSGSDLAATADHYVISYCFPQARNASAWGLDVGSEANRRAAAERAVATGEPAISGRIILVQDGKRQTAFLYYLPVYRNGVEPVSARQRRESLVGLVYTPIILAESLEGVAETVEGALDFEVFDGEVMSSDTLLHDHDGHLDAVDGLATASHTPDRMFTATTLVEVGGRTWTIQTSTTPQFEAGVDQDGAMLIAGGGALLSLLAAGFTFSLLSGRSVAIGLAREMTRDLAEAKRLAEEATRETEAFRSTLDEHSIISVADRSGRIVDANEQFCRISGYSLDELVGRDHRMLNSGVHPKSFWVEVWRELAAGNAWRGEVCNRAKDGSLYWVDSVIAPFQGPDGSIEKYVSIRTDITQRKRGEAELLRVAERLELATSAAGVGIWDYDIVSDTVDWDDQMFALYGILPPDRGGDEVVYGTWSSALHPEDRDRTIAEINNALEGGAPFDSEFRIVRPDGRVCFIRAIAIVQWADDGTPLRMIGTNWDVTAQREAAVELEATSASFEEAQSVAQIGNWSYDLVSGEIAWSRQLFALFGRDERDGVPDIADAVADYDEESATRLEEAMQRAMADGTPYSLILRTNPDRGPEKFVRAEGRVRRAADGRVVGLFGTAMDVTTEIRITESLREARQQAEAANLAKSAFLANMSHEIRTPLTAILGFAELLREDPDGDDSSAAERRTQAVDTILSAGQHLLTVINDILDLSKIEADRMTIERIDTPLVSILGEVEQLMRPRASGKGLAFDTVLDSPIPERVVSDPTRLRQILMNLVGNAIKFTDAGRVRVSVGVQPAADQGQQLVVDITDTGPGLTPDQADLLFKAFGQANETVTRRHGGTGLGLTICRRLAGLMGGKVMLHRTEPGEGSTFRVVLPLEAMPDTAIVDQLRVDRDKVAGDESAAADRGITGRLLLAEDGPDNQRLISFHLRKAGATVDVAENGVVALEMLERAEAAGAPYDLLLSDMQMPEMDGYTLARTLRERGSTMPIIAITANAMAEDRARCEAAGCDDYTSKPIDRRKLIEACRLWLGADGGDAVAGRAAA